MSYRFGRGLRGAGADSGSTGYSVTHTCFHGYGGADSGSHCNPCAYARSRAGNSCHRDGRRVGARLRPDRGRRCYLLGRQRRGSTWRRDNRRPKIAGGRAGSFQRGDLGGRRVQPDLRSDHRWQRPVLGRQLSTSNRGRYAYGPEIAGGGCRVLNQLARLCPRGRVTEDTEMKAP